MDGQSVVDIDSELAGWRQGDVILSDTLSSIHLADLARPGTPEASHLGKPGDEGLAVVAIDIPGLVILTQTCDIVRSCIERPYLEVCPLIELPEAEIALVRRSRRPQFTALPGLGETGLVADLDRVFTIEKVALAAFASDRVRGLETGDQVRDFADAIARKRSRVALPDDFVALAEPLQARVKDKHSRNSDEGAFLRAAREIRVRATPNWDAEEIELEMLFVFDSIGEIPNGATGRVEALAQRVQLSGRFKELSARAVGLDQISAATYLESDRLDLEHLSKPSNR